MFRTTRTSVVRSATFISLAASACMAFAQGAAAPGAGASTPAPLAGEAPAGPFPEDYEVLPVNKAQLLKTTVELGQRATYPTYTEELFRVTWRRHDPIDVFLVKPAAAVKPPVVLFLYGYGSDPEKFLNSRFCATLAAKGFAAVGFQTALTGPRYHDRPLKQWFVSELPESLGASVHDVQLMIDYLETRDDLDSRRIGIFGQGSGGAISILAAAVDPRITAIDVMNPWGDWPQWLNQSSVVPEEERTAYTSSAFLAKVQPLDPVLWMSRLEGRPFRLQETLFDAATPDAVREKMQASLPKGAKLAIYPDQPTYVANVSHDGRMLDWMRDELSITSPGDAQRVATAR